MRSAYLVYNTYSFMLYFQLEQKNLYIYFKGSILNNFPSLDRVNLHIYDNFIIMIV